MVFLKDNIAVTDDHVITRQGKLKEVTDSLGLTIFKHLKKHKDKIAQIDAKTGDKDTFGDLLQRSVRAALHMSERNITRDDVVTLCVNNHRNSVIPYIATQFLGARVAALDPSLSQREVIHLLKQVRPKILFVNLESESIIEKILQDISLNFEIVVFGQTNKHTEFSDFLQSHENEDNFYPVEVTNLKDTAVIHFSSGTTGFPKGICLSHYSYVGQGQNFIHTQNPDFEYMKQQASRVSFPITQLGYTSLYWVSAGIVLLSSILEGYCRLMCQVFDGKEIWNLIGKYKPFVLVLTPVQAREMIENRRFDVDVRSILSIIIMGSAIPNQYFLKIQEAFPEADLMRGYGQTEVCGVLTNFKGNDIFHRPLMKKKEKIESVGLPILGISYKVVDPETNKNLGANQRGELRVKSDLFMNGYFNADSSDVYDDDGWLKTGDIMYYDEDYCFYIVDRIKETFKYKGWFIAPSVLEKELMEHPAVKQAVVIGIPNEHGYLPMGLVVIEEDCKVTEKEIEMFVEERVPERQRLRAGVKFVKYIPLTVTGKVKREEIRQMILNQKYISYY